jgi:hypothetical protein
MSIRSKTIEENGKQTACIGGSRTLTETIESFKNLKYSESNTYLVVTLPNDNYNVILFSDLKEILKKLGPASLTQQLSSLPIPPASRIVPTDTPESGGDIIDWVASHPQSPVVITDAGKIAALFVNPNRSGDSGLADNLSLLSLHGELVQLSQDARADYTPKVQPPICPHCHQANFYKLNEAKQFFCPNCKGIV